MHRLLVGLLFMCACGGANDTVTIDTVTPDFAPLSGGTRIVIDGSGFLGGAPPNRVVIGGTEAPLAAAVNDRSLEVTVPPGEEPGEVDVIVINRNGTATVSGAFHYSTTPTIEALSPDEVLFDAETTVTITGSGFQDEGAGVVNVLVNGLPAVDVEVTSDTTLTFTALGGDPFVASDVEVTNRRGTILRERAFIFAPTAAPSLVLITQSATTFAVAYDPIGDIVVTLPNKSPNPAQGFRSIVRDQVGDFWAVNRNNNQLVRVDVGRQTIDPNTIALSNQLISLTQLGSTTFAFERNQNIFGTLDLTSGSLAPVSTGVLLKVGCCGQALTPGGVALASNSTEVFFYNADGISTVNQATGLRGTVRPLTPARHVRGMRFIGTTLFGVSPGADIFSINPNTGATTTIRNLASLTNGKIVGVEAFIPKN